MKFIKKQSVWSWVFIGSLVFALIGFIIYLATSNAGFLAGRVIPSATLTIATTCVALVVGIAYWVVKNFIKLPSLVEDIVLIVVGVLLSISIMGFILGRVDVAADVWFIPVNYPQSEADTLNNAIIGIAFYFVSLVGVIVSCFGGKLNKVEVEKKSEKATKA